MIGKSYIISRDYGFAPNPFHGVCTLATCKPTIRGKAQLGDWIIATTPKPIGSGKLVCLMEVTETMSFNEYWNSPRFQCKKPILNGSLKQMYGDNIYHTENDEWKQENSHHSKNDGSPEPKNIQTDTSRDRVLISDNYYYFGKEAVEIPASLQKEIVHSTQGTKNVDEKPLKELINYITKNFEKGLNNIPLKFVKFERYDGVS